MPPPAQGNLLNNPSFESNWFNQPFARQKRFLLLQASDAGLAEEDGHIDYWSISGADPVSCWEQQTAHSGRRSLKFERPAQATQRLRMCGENGWVVGGASYGGFFPLAKSLGDSLENRDLVVGAWCKTVDADLPPTLTVKLMFAVRPKIDVVETSPSKTVEQQIPFAPASHDWEYREIKLDASKFPGIPYFAEITLGSGSTKGKVWFDDVSAREVIPSADKNLIQNPDFAGKSEQGNIRGWSSPVLWDWFRNQYYTWTGWSHFKEQSWRGNVALDQLVTYGQKPTLKFTVMPGDNFAVVSDPILLDQSKIQLLEIRAMVRADNLRTMEIMAQDETGKWLPQGDFLGDSMEDDAGTYNLGTTGSGTYDWRCVKKYFSPRKPVQHVRIFLCARGFDGIRPAKDIVGTAWWTQIQLYQHGPQPAWCSNQPHPATIDKKSGPEIKIDLGQRLYGKNHAIVSAEFGQAQRKEIEGAELAAELISPANASKIETSRFRILREPSKTAPGLAEASVDYALSKMCANAIEQYRLKVNLKTGNETKRSDYAFGTSSQIVDCEANSYYPSPKDSLLVLCRLNISDDELKEKSKLELVQEGPAGSQVVLQTLTDFHGLDSPHPSIDGMDMSRTISLTVKSGSAGGHDWAEPCRDQKIFARIYSNTDKLLAHSDPFSFGFLSDPPDAPFPSSIVTTTVNQRGYIEVNGKPYFPVFWTPNFEKKSGGNYPPRFFGAHSVDLNPLVYPAGELPQPLGTSQLASKVNAAKSDPHLFGYEVGDGEMQLQGPTWPARLAVASQAIKSVRQTDPNHVVCGPESWLIGHPGHDEALTAFAPIFDVIGVETSFEDVPKANLCARPFWGQGHSCAVLAGLEAYFFQAPESLRWRGYRSIYEGCAGVGLCPSEMLKARAVVLTYLKGLNGEFRGLERIFTAPEPATAATLQPTDEIQVFEREAAGRHYLFAIRAPGKQGSTSVTFDLPSRPQQIRVRCEGRAIGLRQGKFTDTFVDQYAVHVYEY